MKRCMFSLVELNFFKTELLSARTFSLTEALLFFARDNGLASECSLSHRRSSSEHSPLRGKLDKSGGHLLTESYHPLSLKRGILQSLKAASRSRNFVEGDSISGLSPCQPLLRFCLSVHTLFVFVCFMLCSPICGRSDTHYLRFKRTQSN